MQASIEVGQIFAGKYAVERVLAEGGAGVVVKATHLSLLEPCAIKFLRTEALEAPMARERFLREARACARLKSDHVVRVFDVGEIDAETPYMVFEYLEGVDLDTHMDERPLPVAEAALYVLQICAALAEAHALGIVHRDIKPPNVFLARRDDGTTRVKLLDFGISKMRGDPAGADQVTTMEGTVMGTPFFMSPEQARGEEVDARTDIWSVGVLLYYVLTGRLPFEGDMPFKTLQQVLASDPPPPSQILPSIPPELDRIVLWCLEKDAAARPSGVHEIAAALAPFSDEDGAPLSLHVRRVLESTADERASLPGVPMSGTPLPAVYPAATTPVRARPRWMVPAAIAAVIVAAIVGVSLAPRAPRSEGTPAVTASASAQPVPAVTTDPGTPATADPTPPPLAAPVTASAASAAPPASASARPATTGDAPKAPGATSETPKPVAPPKSPGFDLGSRF